MQWSLKIGCVHENGCVYQQVSQGSIESVIFLLAWWRLEYCELILYVMMIVMMWQKLMQHTVLSTGLTNWPLGELNAILKM